MSIKNFQSSLPTKFLIALSVAFALWPALNAQAYDYASLRAQGHLPTKDNQICWYIPMTTSKNGKQQNLLPSYGAIEVPVSCGSQNYKTTVVLMTAKVFCVRPDNSTTDYSLKCSPASDGSPVTATECYDQDFPIWSGFADHTKFQDKYGRVAIKDGILIDSSKVAINVPRAGNAKASSTAQTNTGQGSGGLISVPTHQIGIRSPSPDRKPNGFAVVSIGP